MMIQTPNQKTLHPLLAPIFLIVLFAAASIFAILIMEQQKTPTLPNDTAWMEAYFTRIPTRELSVKQAKIIKNSTAITSAVAEDAGVKITLRSVCGNGLSTYYWLDVELPESMNAGQGYSFEKYELKMNDNQAPITQNGWSSETLEDGNPTDHRYSLLLTTEFDYYPGLDYQFDNGIVRTLHLENIQVMSENGEKSSLIEGAWDFGVLFHDEGNVIELVQEPMTVSEYSWFDYTSYEMKPIFYEAEINSVALSEFSLYCSGKATPNSERNTISFLHPVIIMKDGRTVRGGASGGGNASYTWHFSAPISLDEVAFVKLTDGVVLPIPQK
ncbi:MAG: hypothetical protein K0S60_557 [Evtepia sp.]|jgi:hypothetical protein|nr:hypothetical protein [Evtepia sp.]